jgi:hypothetical protein
VIFPGTTDRAQAQPVRAVEGEEQTADFTLPETGKARVTGTVLDAAGAPVSRASVWVVGGFGHVRGTGSRADGRFGLTDLIAGPYTITVSHGVAPSRADPNFMQAMLDARANAWAEQSVIVPHSGDIDLVFRLQPTLTVSGQVKFRSNAPVPEPKVAVSVVRTDGWHPTLGIDVRGGTFGIKGVLPGIYRFSVEVPRSSAWWLESAEVGGRDIVGAPLTLTQESGGLAGIVATLSNQRSALSGRLLTADDRPATPFWVVVVSTDRRAWYDGSLRIARARPATDGEFHFPDLPVGEYVLGAVDKSGAGDWPKSELLESLTRVGVAVSVRAGQPARHDLRVR